MSTVATIEKMDSWLASRLGRKQMDKIEKEQAADTYAARKVLADRVAKIEAERDEILADLTKKVDASTERHDVAKTEFDAALANMHALRRQRTSACDSRERVAEKLRHKLRETSDKKIGDFIHKTFDMRDQAQTEQWQEELRRTDRPGKASWAVIAEVFSNKSSIEERVAAINNAREAAITLQTLAVKDVDAELQKIRDTIPGGDLPFIKTGEVDTEA